MNPNPHIKNPAHWDFVKKRVFVIIEKGDTATKNIFIRMKTLGYNGLGIDTYDYEIEVRQCSVVA
jgi:hypothetical protein